MQVTPLKCTVFVSGIDWMISYIHWKSRSIPEQDNYFCIFLEVSDMLFDRMDDLCTCEFPAYLSDLLGGQLCRNKKLWLPIWRVKKMSGSILTETIECLPQIEDSAFFNQPLPRHKKIMIQRVKCGGKKILIYKFSHLLFDGIGAEFFIQHHLKGDFQTISLATVYPCICSWKKIAASGKKLKLFMQKLTDKNIVLFPHKNNTCISCHVISFQGNVLMDLRNFAEKKYGPYSFSHWIFAQILCFLNDLIEDMNLPGDYIMLPMSVDQRIKNNRKGSIFFNQWSIMPLLFSRTSLRSPEHAFSAIRAKYIEALENHIPEMFFEASGFMRLLPYRLIDLFVRISPGATVGTAMYSYLTSNLNFSKEIKNGWHQPIIPPLCPLGIFVNDFGDTLNIVTSSRNGEIPKACLETFQHKIENISSNLK